MAHAILALEEVTVLAVPSQRLLVVGSKAGNVAHVPIRANLRIYICVRALQHILSWMCQEGSQPGPLWRQLWRAGSGHTETLPPMVAAWKDS